MGKAAGNEQLKLRATYYNNIAVGLAVAGGFIPYATFGINIGELIDRLTNGPSMTPIETGKVLGSLSAIVVAISLSVMFRRLSHRIAGKIEGD